MKQLAVALLLLALVACQDQQNPTVTPVDNTYPQPTATAVSTETTVATATVSTATAAPLETTTTPGRAPVPAPQGVPSVVRQPQQNTDMSAVPSSAAPRISLDEARTKLASGDAILVDVRMADAFATGRAAGAMNVPVTDIASHVAHLPRDKMIITYCT